MMETTAHPGPINGWIGRIKRWTWPRLRSPALSSRREPRSEGDWVGSSGTLSCTSGTGKREMEKRATSGMKRAVIRGKGEAALVDAPVPEPREDWVLVKVHAAPMCTEYKGFV